MQKRVVTMMTRYGGDMVRGVVVGVRVLTVAGLFFFYLSILEFAICWRAAWL